MITFQRLKAAWLKACIAYHRRKADSYSAPTARSYSRDDYVVWMRTMALRHWMKAHDLERRLLMASGLSARDPSAPF